MKIGKLLALIMCLSLMMSTSVFAAEVPQTNEEVVTLSDDTFYEKTEVFDTYCYGSFSIPSQTYCSIIINARGIGHTQGLTFAVYDSNGNVYVSEAISLGTSHAWRKTLPAGNYTYRLIGSSNYQYAYTLMVSRF